MGADTNAQGFTEVAPRATGRSVYLGPQLQMVHGVSGDSSMLVAAANAILARPDSFTEGTRQHQNNVDRITMIPQASGMINDPAAPVGPSPVR